MRLEEILSRFGLIAVFAGAAVEGDVTMILAGVVAHLGFMRLPDAVVVGTLGGFTADAVAYGLGRVWAALIGEVKHVEIWLFGALLGGVLLFAFIRAALRRRWQATAS